MRPCFVIRYALVSILGGLAFGLIVKPLYLTGLLCILIFCLSVKKKFLLKLVLSLVILSGLYAHQFQKTLEKTVLTISSEILIIQGKTLNYAEIKTGYFKQHFEVSHLNHSETKGRLILKYKHTQPIPPNSTIEFKGTLKAIPSVPDFNYARYLKQFGISAISQPEFPIQMISPPKKIWEKIGPSIRNFTEKSLQNTLPPIHQNLALGMTIGHKAELPPVEAGYIKDAGLQHLIVVSGSNVTLLTGFIFIIFRRTSPRLLLAVVTVALIIFWWTVGPEPPVNRAIIFGLCGSLGLLSGRSADNRNLLLFAAVIMAISNPLLLTHSVSFWLSLLATFGIITLIPIFVKITHHLKIPFKISLLLGLVVSAQITVMPLILHQFGSYPAGGFVSNLIVEPLVPLIMINTCLLAIFSSVPILSEGLSFMTFWLINLVLLIGKIFSQGPTIELSKNFIFAGFGLQVLSIIYALFSTDYENRFLKFYNTKLDLSRKEKRI